MAEHNTLTGANLHEPKGVAAAAVNKVYVSDGAGSGAYKTIYTHGTEDDNHDGANQNLGIGFANRTYLLNDAAGAFTTSANRLPTKTDVWDVANNEFDWLAAGYLMGDRVTIRLDVDIITTGANRDVSIGMELAIGGSSYTLNFSTVPRKSSGTLANHTAIIILDLGDTNTLNNTGKIFMYSDGSGDSIAVNGWRVFMDPRNPIFN
jgi:hypothetical protein